jgi:hypothetical protein
MYCAAFEEHAPNNRVAPRPEVEPSNLTGQFIWEPSRCEPDRLADLGSDHHGVGPAQPSGGLCQCIEYLPQVESGAADDLKNLRCGGLLIRHVKSPPPLFLLFFLSS